MSAFRFIGFSKYYVNVCMWKRVRLQNKQQIQKLDPKQDVSWTTMCCKHTCYGRSLEDVFTSNNTLWTTTQPPQRHLSFTHEHRKEPSQPNVSLVKQTENKHVNLFFYDRFIISLTSLMNRRRKTTDSAPRL